MPSYLAPSSLHHHGSVTWKLQRPLKPFEGPGLELSKINAARKGEHGVSCDLKKKESLDDARRTVSVCFDSRCLPYISIYNHNSIAESHSPGMKGTSGPLYQNNLVDFCKPLFFRPQTPCLVGKKPIDINPSLFSSKAKSNDHVFLLV